MRALLSGQQYRQVGVSAQRGPEHHGPCPVCGGRDRFHIWPQQGEGGSFWCRGCGKGGDLVEFYRWRDGLSYKEACARAGVDARAYAPQSAPSLRGDRNPNRSSWQPTRTEPVHPVWSEHAAKFADWCHIQLLENGKQLQWLADRGIDGGMIAKFGLGWNPADTWRPRVSWGLEKLKKADGKPKKLWLPLGLVIPQRVDGVVQRLRIRRPEGEPKYYVVPGSGREPMVTRRDAIAHVVVESELDAVLLDGLAGDIVGIVAMGNSSAKPTADLFAMLGNAIHLSVSLDSDKPTVNRVTGKAESAGAVASRWWLEQFRQADRVPVIGGKDPGEAFKAGIDLRAWVLAGLPPRFHFKERMRRGVDVQPAATVPESGPSVPENRAIVPPSSDVEKPVTAVNHRILTLIDGREVHITDQRNLWEELVAEGKVVFSEQELLRLQAACKGMSPEESAAAALLVVDAKEVFAGAYVRRGEVVAEREMQDACSEDA